MRDHRRLQELVDQTHAGDLIQEAVLARTINPSTQPLRKSEEMGASSTSELAYRRSSEALQDLYARCWKLDKMPLPISDLTFLHPPRISPPSLTAPSHLELDKACPVNFPLLDRQESFYSLKEELNAIDDLKEDALRAARSQVETYIHQAEKKLEDRITREWEVQAARELNKARFENICTVVDTCEWFLNSAAYLTLELKLLAMAARYYDYGGWKEPMVHLACWFLVVVLNLVFGVSSRQSSFILKSLDVIVGIVLATCARFQRSPSPSLPRLQFDLRSAMARFNLDSPTISFICCPRCYALYPSEDAASIPALCPENTFSGPCGESLFKSGKRSSGEATREPRKLFEYRSPKEWLGELMSRPGMEALMDETAKSASPRGVASDIWHGSILPSFKWKDGSSFWSTASGGGRYMFSLGIDWFNPLHNVASQKSWSIGAIYLVLLNLPPAIRTLPENICLVGIIPGPKKPPGASINHFLRPLVNDLLDFWNYGVWYTRTALYPYGRLVHAALGPLVCDLDAARGIAGFTSHSHTLFCSLCYLCRENIGNINRSTWPFRAWQDHRRKAKEWREATTSQIQDEIKDTWGLQWSELLRLPYWDPLQFTVIDVMHNMFLGNLKRHCRNIWKMTVEVEGEIGDGLEFDEATTLEEIENARFILATGSEKSLKTLKKHILRDLCRECDLTNEVAPRTSKREMVKLLVEWRHQEGIHVETPGQRVQCTDEELSRGQQLLATKAFTQLQNCKSAVLYKLCEQNGLLARLTSRPVKKDMLLALETWVRDPSATSDPPSAEAPVQKKPSEAEVEAGRQTIQLKSMAAVERLKKSVLLTLCTEVLEPCNVHSGSTKSDLVEALSTWRSTRGIRDSGPSSSDGGNTRTILGSKILAEIELDMRETILPDWVQKAPFGLGSKGNGALSADQWRVACCIHFVVTLIRLWGGSPKESANFKMLNNFIHLVLAASLVARRSTFRERWERVIYHMQEYLKGVQELYPWANLVPNHHLALHLDQFLRSFGPPHAWWAFPFERFNGMLQEIQTNFRLGNLEGTIMRSFSRAARLKGLVNSRGLPPPLKGFYDIVIPLLTSKYRGTLCTDQSALALADWVVMPKMARDERPLTNLESVLLRNAGVGLQAVQDCAYLDGKGARFHPLGRGEETRWEGGRNSSILYQPKDGPPIVARISRIVRSGRTDSPSTGESVFVFVHHYETLSTADAEKDIYQQWPELACFLVYNSFEQDPVMIQPSEIIAHIARCPLCPSEPPEEPTGERQMIVVLSLDRS